MNILGAMDNINGRDRKKDAVWMVEECGLGVVEEMDGVCESERDRYKYIFLKN